MTTLKKAQKLAQKQAQTSRQKCAAGNAGAPRNEARDARKICLL
jgi:hypothetical protein